MDKQVFCDESRVEENFSTVSTKVNVGVIPTKLCNCAIIDPLCLGLACISVLSSW